MDNLRPSPFAPNPWCGASNVAFNGAAANPCGQVVDAGAILITNTTGQTMYVSSVVVSIGSDTFNLWGAFSIPSGTSEILTQTSSLNFDTSDTGQGDVIPNISITYTLGSQTLTVSAKDIGQVLNTGGIDLVNGVDGVCPGPNNAAGGNKPGNCNESLQWRLIGTSGIANPGGTTPEPASLLLLGSGLLGIAVVLKSGKGGN